MDGPESHRAIGVTEVEITRIVATRQCPHCHVSLEELAAEQSVATALESALFGQED
jgi:hypothetical protein